MRCLHFNFSQLLYADTEILSTNNALPVYLTNIACFGLERRLVECRRGQLSNITNCNTRVGAYCTECKFNLHALEEKSNLLLYVNECQIYIYMHVNMVKLTFDF